jgi:4-amino-4-deoxy-L-arabinose transferase-like glycosyltransferase
MSDKTPPRRRVKWLPWLLAALCAAHVGLLVAAASDPEASLRFDRTGRRLASADLLLEAVQGGGSSGVGEVLLTRGAPGDYAWHAAVLSVTGRSLVAVQLVQLLLAALSLVAVHRIALALDGRREVALLATALYAVIPIDFILPHFVASEAFFNPLLLFGVAALVRYATRAPDIGSIAAAGVAFGLAALTRPEALPWLIVMLGFAAALAMRVARERARLHMAVLALLTFGGVCVWLALVPAEPVVLERAALTLEWELANRAHRVLSAAGADTTGIESAPLIAFVRSLLEHPLAFLREFALQAGKLLALPDNLDTFRYLGLYEFTGRRSEWVHALGVVGAARRVFEEMPALATWLAVTIALWLAVAAVALRGAVDVLRRCEGVERILYLLLLSLPVVWTLLRVLTQGESRKRSPVDFAITIFAAIGWWRARYTRARPSRAHGGVA